MPCEDVEHPKHSDRIDEELRCTAVRHRVRYGHKRRSGNDHILLPRALAVFSVGKAHTAHSIRQSLAAIRIRDYAAAFKSRHRGQRLGGKPRVDPHHGKDVGRINRPTRQANQNFATTWFWNRARSDLQRRRWIRRIELGDNHTSLGGRERHLYPKDLVYFPGSSPKKKSGEREVE